MFSTSVVGLAFPTYAAYAASKGAVEAMTLILARELRGRDVTVNAVAPGPTATELFLDGKDEEAIARLAAQPPLERLGTPGRHRRGRRVPGLAGRPLGQRPGRPCQRRDRLMPFANFKVPAGTLSAEQKELIVHRATELYVELYGERARASTMVLVEEVADGGWGIGDHVLTAAMLSE